MSSALTRYRPESCRALAQRVGMAVSLLGVLVLAGWVFEFPLLKSVLPGLATMKPNTALCFLLAGFSLRLAVLLPASQWLYRLGQGGALLASLTGALTLAECLFGWDLGIDHFLLRDTAVPFPGRMSPATALNFLLTGIALLCLKRRPLLAQALALAVALDSLLALAGYLYGVSALYTVGPYSSMALHTALGFFLLGTGVLAARPERGLTALLANDTLGGLIVRRLLPAVVLVSLGVGWLRLEGEQQGLYGTAFGVALFAVANTVALTALLWWNAWLLQKEEGERRGAEAALRESEERFRATFEQAAVGVAHVALDGQWLRVNHRLCDIVGYTEEELRRRTFQDLTHPDDLDADLVQARRLLAGEIRDYAMEKRYFRKDGSIVWINLTGSMVRKPSGEPDYFIAVVEDISGRKRAEEALRQSERNLSIRNRVAQICLTMAEDDMYAEVLRIVLETTQSKYGVFGYLDERGALVVPTMTWSIWDKCQVSDKNIVFPRHQWGDSIWPRAIHQKQTLYSNERSLNTPPGHVEILRNLTVPILHQSEVVGLFQAANKETDYDRNDIQAMEDVAGYIAPILDARLQRDREEKSRKRAEEEIRQLNAELEQRVKARTAELEAFSYSVSHDLRAPLRAMDGFSRILVEEYGPHLEPEARRYLHLVRDNARQMGQLVDDLLAFSRLGRKPLEKQPVAPLVLVSQALEELRAEQEGRQVEWVVGELPPCQADPVLLRQVMVNLLSNALKFTRKREQALIEVGHQQGAYFVRDNGVGFDMRYAGKLFGVFQRLHRAEEYEGTGVGLAIVQRIVHRHNGQVWAQAQVDRGATFFFTIGGAPS